jgi:hypothetical protein
LSLRLVFIPERNYWCVVREGVWHRVANEIDVADLLGVLRAEIVKTKRLEEFPAIMYYAAVAQIHSAECVVVFTDRTEQILARETISINNSALADLNWSSGKYGDGWTALTAELEVEASGLLEFELFLPPSELFGDKELTATIGHDVAFRCDIARGAGVRTPAIDLDEFGSPATVCLSAAYADLAPGDQRDLGVLMISVLLNGVPVFPGIIEF